MSTMQDVQNQTPSSLEHPVDVEEAILAKWEDADASQPSEDEAEATSPDEDQATEPDDEIEEQPDQEEEPLVHLYCPVYEYV